MLLIGRAIYTRCFFTFCGVRQSNFDNTLLRMMQVEMSRSTSFMMGVVDVMKTLRNLPFLKENCNAKTS